MDRKNKLLDLLDTLLGLGVHVELNCDEEIVGTLISIEKSLSIILKNAYFINEPNEILKIMYISGRKIRYIQWNGHVSLPILMDRCVNLFVLFFDRFGLGEK